MGPRRVGQCNRDVKAIIVALLIQQYMTSLDARAIHTSIPEVGSNFTVVDFTWVVNQSMI
jgi:hypothetical protein